MIIVVVREPILVGIVRWSIGVAPSSSSGFVRPRRAGWLWSE